MLGQLACFFFKRPSFRVRRDATCQAGSCELVLYLLGSHQMWVEAYRFCLTSFKKWRNLESPGVEAFSSLAANDQRNPTNFTMGRTSEAFEVRHEGITFRPLVLSSASLQELIDTCAKKQSSVFVLIFISGCLKVAREQLSSIKWLR